MCIELKIKSKHLALESKVIRFEESKLNKQIKWLDKNDPNRRQPSWSGKSDYWKTVHKYGSLVDHRRNVVGRENRATFLARAYLEGKKYNTTEQLRRVEKESEFQGRVLPRVLDMVKKYGQYSEVKNLTIDDIRSWAGSI
jgi:hypothetical protein